MLRAGYCLLKASGRVLLEAAPAGVSVAEIGTALASYPGVENVHDLHVWELGAGFPSSPRTCSSGGKPTVTRCDAASSRCSTSALAFSTRRSEVDHRPRESRCWGAPRARRRTAVTDARRSRARRSGRSRRTSATSPPAGREPRSPPARIRATYKGPEPVGSGAQEWLIALRAPVGTTDVAHPRPRRAGRDMNVCEAVACCQTRGGRQRRRDPSPAAVSRHEAAVDAGRGPIRSGTRERCASPPRRVPGRHQVPVLRVWRADAGSMARRLVEASWLR